jgi:hypothetical protein
MTSHTDTRCDLLTLGDQSRSVTDLFAVHRSSENAQNSLTFCPSASSLFSISWTPSLS